MKKFLLSLGLSLAFTLTSFAAQSVTNITTAVASTNAILNGQFMITQVAVANPTAVTLTVSLYDAYNSTNLTYSRGAYTNYLTYSTNYVTTFTNFTGVVQNSTNAAYFTVANPVAANTNNFSTLVTLDVAAGDTVTYTPVNGLITSFGLTSKVNTNATITTTYSNLR